MQIEALLPIIQRLHAQIRDTVVSACEKSAIDELSKIESEGRDDTIYRIDRISENALIGFVEREIAPLAPVVLIAEGLETGQIVLPQGTTEDDAEFRLIVDPIDGTRGLMVQKRSGWILTGVAPNRGKNTDLQDIELAVQTEIPLIKQHLSDQLRAVRGKGMQAVRHNRLSGRDKEITLRPSNATTIAHGFAMLARFFPGARDLIAKIDEEIIHGALGPVQPGKTHCFEDQYISTGGQLYELIAGHDRFNADIRPLLKHEIKNRKHTAGITCHPYDICTELIAHEAGVIIADENGGPLHARLTTDDEITWVGYANTAIRQQIEPLLRESLRKRKLIEGLSSNDDGQRG